MDNSSSINNVSSISTEDLELKIVALTSDLRSNSFNREYSFFLVMKRALIHKERLSYIREWSKRKPGKYMDDLLTKYKK